MYETYARFRDMKGLRDADVAKESGVSPTTISQWKHGVCTPKAAVIKRIARVLEVPTDWLIEDKE